MYPFDPIRLPELRKARWSGLGANIVYLGLTSFFTDISSEMVVSILPMYLVFALRLTPLQFGFIDGLYQGAAAMARLASGLIADRSRRNREVAAMGYSLSALCKVGMLAAGSAWSLLAGVIALDRIGKGMRSAPRDALISLSCTPGRLGLAFGIHRAFDTAGALLGPLIAFGILAITPETYDVIFVTSFAFAVVGLATLLIFVRNPRQEGGRAPRSVVSIRAALSLLRPGRLRMLLLAGSALSVCTMADAFIYLAVQRLLRLDANAIPLLFVGTATAYLVLAIPAGRIADRVGRGRLYFWGHALLLLGCLGLLMPWAGVVPVLLCLAMLGGYYACTDGVLMATASTMVSLELRASGLALVTTATGLSRFFASLGFGAFWNWWGLETAIAVFAVGLSLAMLLTYPILTRTNDHTEDERTITG